MNPPIRLLLCLVYAHGLLVLLDHLHPGWMTELHHEVNRFAQQHREQDRLKVRMGEVASWRQAKHVITTRLIAEQLTLQEAAGQFQQLNERYADMIWWRDFRHHQRGDSDRERHVSEVITSARRFLADQSPERREAVLARLQLERDLPDDGSSSLE